MDNLIKILEDMASAATKMRVAILYTEAFPEDPHGGDEVDYSRDFVLNTIHRFQTIGG